MKLKAYLAEEEMTLKEFAKLIGVHENYLTMIIHGRANPGKRLVRDIHFITDGKVTLPVVKKKEAA
jgi:transcriptional regulator with XRE-family HTH domain